MGHTVPVLAGSAAYGVSEMLGWVGGSIGGQGKSRPSTRLFLSRPLAAALDITSLDPMQALYWAAALNGVLQRH
jgi:hypothetical protein